MREVYQDEIHHLRPHIRAAMFEGRRRYRGQVGDVVLDDKQVENAIRSGQVKHAGGIKALSATMFLRDRI